MKKLNVKKNTNKPEIPGKVKKDYQVFTTPTTKNRTSSGAAAGDHHSGGGLRIL